MRRLPRGLIVSIVPVAMLLVAGCSSAAGPGSVGAAKPAAPPKPAAAAKAVTVSATLSRGLSLSLSIPSATLVAGSDSSATVTVTNTSEAATTPIPVLGIRILDSTGKWAYVSSDSTGPVVLPRSVLHPGAAVVHRFRFHVPPAAASSYTIQAFAAGDDNPGSNPTIAFRSDKALPQ